MPEITKEYPEGRKSLEMALVKMLSDKRCWLDYVAIGNALHNIRMHAESMEKERDKVCASAVESSAAKP